MYGILDGVRLFRTEECNIDFNDIFSAFYCTVGHKSHDPCFHVFLMEIRVMTFVTHCKLIHTLKRLPYASWRPQAWNYLLAALILLFLHTSNVLSVKLDQQSSFPKLLHV